MEKRTKEKPKNSEIKIVLPVVIALVLLVLFLSFYFFHFFGLFSKPHPPVKSIISTQNTSSVPSVMNIINKEESIFSNASPFSVYYNMTYNSVYNGVKSYSKISFIVNRYTSNLNFTTLSASNITYFNSTFDRNLTVNFPIIHSILYNASGELTCYNNALSYSSEYHEAVPNQSGFYSYTCKFFPYNTTSFQQIEIQQYANVFTYQLFMMNKSDHLMTYTNLSNISNFLYNSQVCSLYNITYNSNNYQVCFSPENGIPIFIKLHVLGANSTTNISINGSFKAAPTDSSKVIDITDKYTVS
ncbi:hypothetical protein M1494_00280 [Candidatus Parvarchaeota archaeon]|nr:hypothetical protein [Candidatus Parvarchaeota archaeon]